MGIINIDGFGPVTVDDSFFSLSDAEKNKVVDEISASLTPVPRERLRAAAQGATFGLADEVTAAVTNPKSALEALMGGGGEDYYARLESERKKLADYRAASPVESTLYEAGGGILPALAAAPFTGGGSVAAQAPLMARAVSALPSLLKYGAASGGAYGFGTSEGGPVERLKGAFGGAVTGAALAPVAAALTYPLAAGAKSLGNFARSKFGNKAGKAVEAEVQRLAEATGLTTDEIVARISRGEIMAENETLRMSVRALMAEGGLPETMVRDTMKARPMQKRQEAMDEIQGYLSGAADTNVKRVQKTMDKAARQAERDAYENIPNAKLEAPSSVNSAVVQSVRQFPAIAKELAEYVGGLTKSKPFFALGDQGTIQVGRIPTLQEAEIVRRFLSKKTGEAYRSGSPMGEVYGNFEKELRKALDNASPELQVTRATASTVRGAKDAFDYGVSAFSKDPDEFEIFLEQIADKPEAVKALRAGVMAALRRKASGGSGTSLMSKLSSEERDYGKIFRAIFPEENIDDVMRRVEVAAQSQDARNAIIQGPSTALTQAAGKKLGSGINAEELASMARGNPIAALQVGMKLAKQLSPNLTENQREKILKVLLSEDPQIVKNALRDESGAAKLSQALQQAAAVSRRALTGGLLAPTTEAGGRVTSPLRIELNTPMGGN